MINITFCHIILIDWANQNHYERLIPKNLDESEIPIEFQYNIEEEMP